MTGKGVLLEGTALVRTGLAWFKPTHVQLLAAPASDGTSCEPAWSALVVGGVAMPYEELAGVKMDESVLEFVVAHKPRTTTAQDPPPPHYLRMYTRSEFNLWREALGLRRCTDVSRREKAAHVSMLTLLSSAGV